LAVGLIGVALRLLLWWFSIGSNDTVLWSFHARHVLGDGLAYFAYRGLGAECSKAECASLSRLRSALFNFWCSRLGLVCSM
jgi:hypothetical protein